MVHLLFATSWLSLVCVAAAFDVVARRVPNLLVAVLLVVSAAGGALRLSPAQSMWGAGFGLLVGLAIWIPFWLVGLLGAGDVKFFAAASAWIGPALAWRASIAVALLGGALGVVFLLCTRGGRASVDTAWMTVAQSAALIRGADAGASAASSRTFPYAVPMAIALASAAFYPSLFRGFL